MRPSSPLTMLAIALLAVLGCIVPAGAQTCRGIDGQAYHELGYDVYGQDFHREVHVADACACRELCVRRMPECQFFTHVRNICYLKKLDSRDTYVTLLLSNTRTPIILRGTLPERTINRNSPLPTVHLPTLDDCRDFCLQSRSCSYVIYERTNQTCTPFIGVLPTASASGATARVPVVREVDPLAAVAGGDTGTAAGATFTRVTGSQFEAGTLEIATAAAETSSAPGTGTETGTGTGTGTRTRTDSAVETTRLVAAAPPQDQQQSSSTNTGETSTTTSGTTDSSNSSAATSTVNPSASFAADTSGGPPSRSSNDLVLVVGLAVGGCTLALLIAAAAWIALRRRRQEWSKVRPNQASFHSSSASGPTGSSPVALHATPTPIASPPPTPISPASTVPPPRQPSPLPPPTSPLPSTTTATPWLTPHHPISEFAYPDAPLALPPPPPALARGSKAFALEAYLAAGWTVEHVAAFKPPLLAPVGAPVAAATVPAGAKQVEKPGQELERAETERSAQEPLRSD
ncbi:hypothetical protein HDU96_001270 [Phlyctochytrium bullatum]|nr:hypothetical protein HDU96_001270 [Phlyctochytrium bullatum]